MLTRILSYHQVMPDYLDLICVFGLSAKPRDLRFSCFREQTLLGDSFRRSAVPEAGRSGQQFQLCYNLNAPFCSSAATPTPQEKQWGIRKVAVHHQFDAIEGTTLWIITKGNLDFKDLVQKMTGKTGRPEDRAFGTPQESFVSSLAIHLLNCHWSTDEWRWYIQWLEEVLDSYVRSIEPSLWGFYTYASTQTDIAVSGPREKSHARYEYSTRDLQDIQYYEGKSNEAVTILEGNIEVITALRAYYQGLLTHGDFPMGTSCHQNITGFAIELDKRVYELRMQISRAKLLTRTTADTKSLVSFCS